MFHRIFLSIPLNYREVGGDPDFVDPQLTRYGHSHDISFGGVRIQVPSQIIRGRIINLKMILPVTDYCRRISVNSQVCWTKFQEDQKDYEVGVHFVGINHDTLNIFHEFFEEMNNRFS